MFYENYYYIVIGLQALCAFHSYRQGTFNKWIWAIIFLPVIGCLIYIYSEIIGNRRFNKPKLNVDEIFIPGAKLKKLEQQLIFSDTFDNKVKLADACLAAGQTARAIDLYNASLTGAFTENEYVLAQLIIANYQLEHYEEVISLTAKIYKRPQFLRSKAHICYAKALENLRRLSEAEQEFKLMKGRYSHFGPRFEYGLFLARNNRDADASTIFQEMLEEEQHLGKIEKRSNREWFVKAREELRRLG